METFKIYMAGRYTSKRALRKWRERLNALEGVKVISDWLDETDEIKDKEDIEPSEWAKIAWKDLRQKQEVL